VKQSYSAVLPDGTFLDLVRPDDSTHPRLVLWRDGDQTAGDTVECRGEQDKACSIHPSILCELKLPAHVGSFGSVRELLAEVCNAMDQFVGLPEKFTALVGRFVLATWLIGAMPTAPRVVIEEPDSGRARQLFEFFHCACRRALPMSAVTPAGLCSLPSGMQFTLLLRDMVASPSTATVLRAATVRGNPILRAGALRDLFGAQVVLGGSGFDGELTGIRVPCLPDGAGFASLGIEQQQRLVEQLQPKLLAFRFSNYHAARATEFDAPRLALRLRDLLSILAAATPGDRDLQSELHALLHEENSELEAASWVNADTVIVEALLVYCREAKIASVYVSDITDMANQILTGRGESRALDPGDVGKRIRNLGFAKEPRDARGVQLCLSNATCVRAHDLAHRLNVPGIRDCACRDVGSVGKND
jgi:hypothetical protein